MIKNIKTTQDLHAVFFAAGVVAILILALLWSGWRVNRIDNTLHEVMIETAKATSLVFIILLGAAMLTAAFRAFGGEELVRDFLNGLPGGFWTKFVIVMGVIFILGFFLDFIEIAVVVVPIVAPALVKTINMYKGVIAFIALQLCALGIVGYFPPLVNYLPNRMSLLSETAPPPRNPKLQYCIEEYTAEHFADKRGEFDSALNAALSLDLSTLPKKLAGDLEDGFESAGMSVGLIDAVKTAEQAVLDNSDLYRPVHTQVRQTQSQQRELEARKKALGVTLSRVSGENIEARKSALNDRITALDEQVQSLNETLPAEWESENQRHVELQKAETKARSDFRRAADQGYTPVKETMDILAATSALRDLGSAIPNMKTLMETNEPADLIDPLAALADQFGDIAGASKIKSAVSKARSALKKKTPKPDDAMKSIDKAMEEYEEEMQWRNEAEPALLSALTNYEAVIKQSIGIRQQDKLTRDQALSVAACSSHHRDISLNF